MIIETDQNVKVDISRAQSRNPQVESSEVQMSQNRVQMVRTGSGHRKINVANSNAQMAPQLDPIRTQQNMKNTYVISIIKICETQSSRDLHVKDAASNSE